MIKFSDKYEPLFKILENNSPALKNIDTILISGGR